MAMNFKVPIPRGRATPIRGRGRRVIHVRVLQTQLSRKFEAGRDSFASTDSRSIISASNHGPRFPDHGDATGLEDVRRRVAVNQHEVRAPALSNETPIGSRNARAAAAVAAVNA